MKWDKFEGNTGWEFNNGQNPMSGKYRWVLEFSNNKPHLANTQGDRRCDTRKIFLAALTYQEYK